MDKYKLMGIAIVCVVIYAFLNRSAESKARSKALKPDKIKVKKHDPFLDDKINFIQSQLGIVYQPFKLSWKQRHLKKRRINEKKIRGIIASILEHLSLPYTDFNIKVEKNKTPDYAGNYSHNMGIPTIKIVVNQSSTIEGILATICHECTHHFLHEKGIWLPDTNDNEYLTDVTAIYVGFGDIIKKGYQDSKRIVDSHYEQIDDQTYTYSLRTEVNKVGYLSPAEVEYVRRKVKKIQKKAKKANKE